MATFSEAQITDLCRIFGVDSETLGYRLDIYAGVITESDKTAVLADITAFKAIEDDNIHVEAGPAGFRGRISPAEKRSLIKKRIAGLIHCTDLLNSSSRLVRG